MKRILACAVLLSVVVPALASDITLSLRTNYVWPTEFRYVRIELVDATDPTNTWTTFHAGTEASNYLQGVEIAQFEDVKKKRDYYLVIQLLNSSTVPVAGGAWDLQVTKRKSGRTFEIRRR